ncbi:mechanosensitive ion channel domain-containing protein [Mycobacterium sp. IDR2000157661]|uniref:mechanosensitive ion channel domain-containing protein n=1 Tax=Mycobacterium sp. IDR2000157661 TaxID=2867005 RepID=UPI001EEA44CE|nr:mechanosensitive ion channel family protein [Mycobacterium sp. IDR2000157661]ULE32392.1 mechanosensitive ion channel [Mycobacterium sp. IDR2000157661]
MSDILGSAWFYWAVSVAIGFPVALVLLTELHNALRRRGSFLARPVHLVRNYVVPLVALLVLLVGALQISGESTTVRVVATVFGFVVLVLLLSGTNATLFQGAPEGTWRKRIPSIFLDVARFALIALGVGLILAYIWGANIGGLFTALGVSSIVLGLALQNSVGQIISGLLVLFEQPFQLGDWIQTPTARGRVVEVNWRATHIDTGAGLLIMPNSVLAGASFTNYSRPPGSHALTVTTTFAVDDPPDDVISMLNRVAAMLPQLRADAMPSSVHVGGLSYLTSVPLNTPADDLATKTTFLRWVWYAARRAGLHLDEAEDEFETTQRVQRSLRAVAPTLRLNQAEQDEIVPHVRVTRYGTDEYLQASGQVPTRMMFIVSGRVRLVAVGDDDVVIEIRTLETGDFLGQTTLTREPVTASAYALEEVTVVQIERDRVEDLVARKPLLLHDFGRAIEERRATLRRALAAASD